MRLSYAYPVLFLSFTFSIVEFGDAADWELVWTEEFNGESIDNGSWNYEEGCNGFGDHELQCYVADRPENARVQDGKLIITARKEWWGDGVSPDKPFTSAKITTQENWKYGKFEIRAKLPRGKHLWPAFWMMPSESVYGYWPSSGEVDIVEFRGQRTNQLVGSVHFGPSWDQKGAVGPGGRDFDSDFSEDFHTFGFHWDEYAVRWSVDGSQYHSEGITKNFWPGFYTQDGQPYDQPFYLILNLAVGGDFFPPEEYGDFDPEEADLWEQPTLEVDWIKVWQWK